MVHVMSEVKGTWAGGAGGSGIPFYPPSIEQRLMNVEGRLRTLEKSFDAQRLRADTAEAEVARLEDEFDTLENTNTTIKLKLAAAEQRIASHERMLRFFANLADIRQVGTAAMDYVAALNPNPEAESHGS